MPPSISPCHMPHLHDQAPFLEARVLDVVVEHSSLRRELDRFHLALPPWMLILSLLRSFFVQETLRRPSLQLVKMPFAPSPKHFGQFWGFGPL